MDIPRKNICQHMLMQNNIMKPVEILPSIILQPESTKGFDLPIKPSISILILLPESSQWDEEKAYLSKMFEAAQKELDMDVLLWQMPMGGTVSFNDLIQQSSITDIYLFGVEASQIGLQSSLPMGYSAQIGETFLYRTDSPLKVSKNGEMKKRIWELFQKRYLHEHQD